MADVLDNISTRQLPHRVKYSSITPLAVHASSSVKRVSATTGGPFNDQNNVSTFILSSSTAMIDPQSTYLRFQCRVTLSDVGHTMRLDGSASSLIKSIRVSSKSGAGDISFINNYNNLFNVISDVTIPMSARTSLLNIAEGYGTTVANDSSNGTGEASWTNSLVSTKSFCVPIMDSCIGHLNNRYLPLFLTGDIQVQIQWSSEGLFSSSAQSPRTGYEILNPELMCDFVTFAAEPNVNEQLKSIALSTGIYMHVTGFRNYQKTITTAQDNFLINDRLRSVKSLIITNRLPNPTNVQRAMGRISREITSLQVKCGDQLVPSQPLTATTYVDNLPQLTFETLKGFGRFYDTSLVGGVINSTNSNISAASTNASCGRAVFSVSLDSFSNQQIESGMSWLLNNPCTIMTDSTDANQNVLMDCFALFDAILSIKPDGTFSVSY